MPIDLGTDVVMAECCQHMPWCSRHNKLKGIITVAIKGCYYCRLPFPFSFPLSLPVIALLLSFGYQLELVYQSRTNLLQVGRQQIGKNMTTNSANDVLAFPFDQVQGLLNVWMSSQPAYKLYKQYLTLSVLEKYSRFHYKKPSFYSTTSLCKLS